VDATGKWLEVCRCHGPFPKLVWEGLGNLSSIAFAKEYKGKKALVQFQSQTHTYGLGGRIEGRV
jgi:hypothetical protein